MLIVKLAINVVHMPPWVDFQFTFNNQGREVTYSLDGFFTVIMLTRIYLVLRLLTRFTRWKSLRSHTICGKERIEADTLFSLKCLMQERPYLVSFMNFIISSIIFGFAVRTFE